MSTILWDAREPVTHPRATSEIWRADAVATTPLARPQPRSFPHLKPTKFF